MDFDTILHFFSRVAGKRYCPGSDSLPLGFATIPAGHCLIKLLNGGVKMENMEMEKFKIQICLCELQDQGGWLNASVADWFEEYARYEISFLPDLILVWKV